MLFALEVLKAKEGDCLLLHWGTNGAPKIGVIDGGPGNVYEDFLRPRLDAIRGKRALQELLLDFVMVSHVDNDHITGIKKMFAKLKKEVEDNEPQKPIRAERLWHNTFDDIIGNKINAHYQTFSASFTASATGEPQQNTVTSLTNAIVTRKVASKAASAHLAEDIAMVLAGHGEGRQLRDSHRHLKTSGFTRAINDPYGPNLITADLQPSKRFFLGLDITIIGPSQAEIDALQTAFDEYIKKNNLQTPEAALAAYADKSIPNLSSIVCIIEVGNKSILLTGDARGDYIITGLKKSGRLGRNRLSKVHFDILKVPHHGSDRNVTPEFFATIQADTYVFSGDGKHGNPERDTLDWVIASRGKTDKYDLVFTYKIDDIDTRRKSETRRWDHQKHALRALLDQCRADGYSFRIVDNAPQVINLGDEQLSV